MVSRAKRSRSLRRVFRRVPGNRTSLHYKKRKPSPAKCAKCGAILKGVARDFPFKMRKMATSHKRPERPYGGVLCSRCTRRLIIEKARQ